MVVVPDVGEQAGEGGLVALEPRMQERLAVCGERGEIEYLRYRSYIYSAFESQDICRSIGAITERPGLGVRPRGRLAGNCLINTL